MMLRSLRSNTNVLSNGVTTRKIKSRRVMEQSSNELPSASKECKNKEVKKRRKKIRVTENSFHSEDLCENEMELNAQYNKESTNTITNWTLSNESEALLSKKTWKSKKKIRLPTIKLDDFEQPNQDIQKDEGQDEQQSFIYNSNVSEACNVPCVVYERINQNKTENKIKKKHVKDIRNQVENISDSEVEFNCFPKDQLHRSTDFPLTVQDASMVETNKKEDMASSINSMKIMVKTKIDSITDNKKHNISMSLATINCADIHSNRPEKSMNEQSTGVTEISGQRGRKRWTILKSTEARKHFDAEMEILRKSLLISKTEQVNSNKNEILESRRSDRKRWSNELRKSLSANDISMNSNHTLILPSDELLMNLSDRSQSATNYSDHKKTKRRDTYELKESVTDIDLLKILSESTTADIGVDVLPSDNSISLNTRNHVISSVTSSNVLHKPIREIEAGNCHKSLVNKDHKKLEQTSIFSPSLFISSTPLSTCQTSSAQKSLNKENNNVSRNRRRSKSAECNKTITKLKMPNFSKIHKRAQEKMENIFQFAERKAERAKLLLSGQKPESSRVRINSDNKGTEIKHSNKQINFDSSKPSTSKGFLTVCTDIAEREKPNKGLFMEDKRDSSVVDTKILLCNKLKPEWPKAGCSKMDPEKHKNNEKTFTPKVSHNITNGSKTKSIACNENKTKQIKAFITKTKLQQDNRTERRTVLKGVRSNRRFELLMKMRGK